MSVVDELLRGPRTRLHIGGDWAEGIGDMEVVDPATEQVLAVVSMAGHDQARAAVDAAAAAAAGWADMAPRARGEILRRSYEAMLTREEELAELIVLENGKTYADALGEVRYGAEFFRWFSEEAVRITGEFRTAPGGDKRIIVMPEPVGISLMVTPWNFPSAMATRKLGPALAAGCTTILKPASDTPLSALAVVDVLTEAGLPPGSGQRGDRPRLIGCRRHDPRGPSREETVLHRVDRGRPVADGQSRQPDNAHQHGARW